MTDAETVGLVILAVCLIAAEIGAGALLSSALRARRWYE